MASADPFTSAVEPGASTLARVTREEVTATATEPTTGRGGATGTGRPTTRTTTVLTAPGGGDLGPARPGNAPAAAAIPGLDTPIVRPPGVPDGPGGTTAPLPAPLPREIAAAAPAQGSLALKM